MIKWRGPFIHGAALVLAFLESAQAAGDPGKGQQLFSQQCKGCHSLEAGKNGIGPSLHGVLGRKAGALENYNYSTTTKNSGVVWDEDTLKKFLADPRKLIPGNKMVFTGIKNDAQLDNLIAYLKQASQ